MKTPGINFLGVFCTIHFQLLKYNTKESLIMVDITINKFMEYSMLEEPTDEETLCIFLGITKSQLRKMDNDEVERIGEDIKEYLSKEHHFVNRFILNGVEYGFIPNLDKITYGENKDLMAYISDWTTMDRALAVAYRPVTRKNRNDYSIEEYEGSEKYYEAMQEVPFHIASGMLVFFYNLIRDLLNYIPNYLKEEEMVNSQISQENGEAIKKCISYLKAI